MASRQRREGGDVLVGLGQASHLQTVDDPPRVALHGQVGVVGRQGDGDDLVAGLQPLLEVLGAPRPAVTGPQGGQAAGGAAAGGGRVVVLPGGFGPAHGHRLGLGFGPQLAEVVGSEGRPGRGGSRRPRPLRRWRPGCGPARRPLRRHRGRASAAGGGAWIAARWCGPWHCRDLAVVGRLGGGGSRAWTPTWLGAGTTATPASSSGVGSLRLRLGGADGEARSSRPGRWRSRTPWRGRPPPGRHLGASTGGAPSRLGEIPVDPVVDGQQLAHRAASWPAGPRA